MLELRIAGMGHPYPRKLEPIVVSIQKRSMVSECMPRWIWEGKQRRGCPSDFRHGIECRASETRESQSIGFSNLLGDNPNGTSGRIDQLS